MYFLAVSLVEHYLTHQERDSAPGVDYYLVLPISSTVLTFFLNIGRDVVTSFLVVTRVNCMVGYKVTKDI